VRFGQEEESQRFGRIVEANDLGVWRSTAYGKQGKVGSRICIVDDQHVYFERFRYCSFGGLLPVFHLFTTDVFAWPDDRRGRSQAKRREAPGVPCGYRLSGNCCTPKVDYDFPAINSSARRH
jgi:hypothetical protein